MSEPDNRLYRPSWSDRGALCIHHESSEEETAATQNGRALHEMIAYCLHHRPDVARVWLKAKGASEEETKMVMAAVDFARQELSTTMGIEQIVHIYDDLEQEITYGTADVWGYKKED